MKYLDNETMDILNSRVRKMRPEASTRMFLRLLVFLIFFAVHGICSLHAQPIVYNTAANGNGCAWKCSTCHQNNWAASHTKDWQGNYYCKKCGAKR